MAKSDKERALEVLRNSIGKKYGEGALTLGSETPLVKIDGISTGSRLIDDAIGVNGVPEGRLIEIFGDEASGKTTLCTLICVNAQKKYPDKLVGIIDLEHAFNWQYAKELGLDPEKTMFAQPMSGEEALDIMRHMAETGVFSAVLLDSVAAVRTQKQLDGDITDLDIGEVARLLSRNVGTIAKVGERTKTTTMWINQLRDKISVYGGGGKNTTGGNSIKFYASVRLETKRRDILTNKDKDPIGQVVKVIVKKNKVGIPFKEVETELFFGVGFNHFKEVIDLALDKKIISQGGAWFKWHEGQDDEIRSQGKPALIQAFEINPNAFEVLDTELKAKMAGDTIEELEENVKVVITDE